MSARITADDRAEIVDVIALYGHAVDAHDWELLDEILAEGFELAAGDSRFTASRLRMNIAETVPLPAHHVDTTAVALVSPGVARAWSKFIVVSDGVASSGDYLDTLVLRDERWQLWHRDVRRRYDVDSDRDGASRRATDARQWREGPVPGEVQERPASVSDLVAGTSAASAPDRASDASDRVAITEVLHRYGLAVDDRRWDLWDDLFTADAVIDFSRSYWADRSFGWDVHDPGEVRRLLEERSDPTRIDGQHLVLNSIIELRGDWAEVHSEFLAITLERAQNAGSAVRTSTGGWYEDHLRRGGDGGWRIARRTSRVRWQSSETIPLPDERRTGTA